MRPLPNRTFHLVYHDVGSQYNGYTRWIQSMVTPETFSEHLHQLKEVGTICSLEDGLREQNADRPRFVIWFDDAYHGVYQYGFPICQKNHVVASLAVNAQFALRKRCFWRCELSWLLENANAVEVADRILSTPYLTSKEIWQNSLQQYDADLHARISDMFTNKASLAERNAWHDIFMNEHQIKDVAKQGWSICNHSANHPALRSSSGIKAFVEDFNLATPFMQACGGKEDYWVIPFDYGIIKQSVDANLNLLKSESKYLFRAFYFQEGAPTIFPRITITSQHDVLNQIVKAIRPPSTFPLRRLKSFLTRWTTKKS